MTNNHSDACDESKCVSKGRSDLYEGFFTCYGSADDLIFPKMCSHGFQPIVVGDEPPHLTSHGNSNITVNYFTCCPPGSHEEIEALPVSATTNATRHCSDPIIPTNLKGDNYSNMKDVCADQGNRTFAIEKDSDNGSFLCCDSMPMHHRDGSGNASVASDFLDDLECVPYRNEYYEAARVQNKIGRISVISCDFSGDFMFPRPIDGEHHVTTGRFQCCRNGPAMPPFVQDLAFKVTIYPIMISCSLMAVLSLVLVLGLLTPLLIQSKRKKYNVFNFYLVHLGIVDLACAIYGLVLYGLLIEQIFSPDFFPTIVRPLSAPSPQYSQSWVGVHAYVNLSMGINCLICYQVLVLLKGSRRARRIKPPSFTSVNLQVGALYLIAIILGIIDFKLRKEAWRLKDYGDTEKSLALTNKIKLCYSIVPLLLVSYVSYVSISVWYRGYIPKADGSSPRDKAIRELSIYFFRIIWIFLGVWVPGIIFGNVETKGANWLIPIANLGPPVQSILTFFVILTKSDVRKYILDLITLPYLVVRRCTQPIIEKSSTDPNTSPETDGSTSVNPVKAKSSRCSSMLNSSCVAQTNSTIDVNEPMRESKNNHDAGAFHVADYSGCSNDEMIVQNSEDNHEAKAVYDVAADEETGVCHQQKRARNRPRMVSATGKVVVCETVSDG